MVCLTAQPKKRNLHCAPPTTVRSNVTSTKRIHRISSLSRSLRVAPPPLRYNVSQAAKERLVPFHNTSKSTLKHLTMARKPNQTAPTPAGAAPNPFAIDHDTGHGHHKKQPRIDHPSNGRTPQAAPKNSKGSGSEGSSSHRTSDDAIVIADGDVSDADDVDADDEDDEDEDGDALAPSGRTIEAYGDQAGHTNRRGDSHVSVISKNRSGLESYNQATQPIRSSKRNNESHDGESESDDEVYNAVDNISNSDDSTGKDIVAKAPSVIHDTWDGVDFQDDFLSSDLEFYNQPMGRTEPIMLETELEVFPSDNVCEDFEPMPPRPQSLPPPKRRVRFKEPVSSASDSPDIISDDRDIYGLFNSNMRLDKTRDQRLESKARLNDSNVRGSAVGSSSGYGSELNGYRFSAGTNLAFSS